ncbi:MAG TPA: DUF721 domain-containing protein [Candidatus Moranbacteria bacterium]|nr:DUF721 domain-containing protein [Candidatus Moranbacteria bacterium]
MKALGNFLKYRNLKKNKVLDQDTVFYIFKKIIKIKYGEVGFLNIKPVYYKKGEIFLETGNSNWANEIWLNKKILIEEVNEKIGEDEIKKIKLKK